jgi:predicted P-loop ATPase
MVDVTTHSYPAPAALVAHCIRSTTRSAAVAGKVGVYDIDEAKALYQWLFDNDGFPSYMDWVSAGMIAKVEFGDNGLDLWAVICHDQTVDDTALSKWDTFASEATENSQTMGTLFKRAHDLGWKGSLRKVGVDMFKGVAAIAAAAGATLQGGMPMLAGQEELTRLAAPVLRDFLAAPTNAPARPAADEFPTLPAAMSGHGLYADMLECISRVIALSEPPQKFKPAAVVDVLAVLNLLHADVFDAVCRRITLSGHPLPTSKIKLAAANLQEKVERITVTHDKWEYDKNQEPQSDNSDNVTVLLGILGLSLRWNAWLERMEIQGGIDLDLRWTDWTYIDDTVVAKLRTRANRTKTRFRPGKEFLWETLLAIAHANPVDPAVELLATLEKDWDGTARLDSWLSRYCSCPNDQYHSAVGRSLVGGMVSRVRSPGVKFDTMPIFFGPQGTGKSTMLAVLALRPEYFTDSILLGDASKELVLSLAGKMLVEISEMGMRGNTNVNHVKAMISRTTDAGRTAYARAVTERPRRNIFCGSTNDDTPLEDPSGNRRFLPIRIDQEVDLPGLRSAVFQLVGEAAARHTRGESFDIPREVWAIAATHQEAARSVSDMESRLWSWFGETEHTKQAFVSVDDIVDLCDYSNWRNVHGARDAILKKMGFRRVQPYIGGTRTRGWYRGPEILPKHIEHVVRYLVSKTADNRPRVIIRGGNAVPLPTSPGVVLPPSPPPY